MYLSVDVTRSYALAGLVCLCGCVLMCVHCVPSLMEVRDQLCPSGVIYLGFVFYSYALCVSVLSGCAIACVWVSEDNLEWVAFSIHKVVPKVGFRLLSIFTH